MATASIQPIPASIHSLAVELIHLIALNLAVASPPRPPVDLLHLLLTSRYFYLALNLHDNPHLYAQIFRRSFDTYAIARRFPSLPAPVLAHELQRRWTCLSRIRSKTHPELHPYVWGTRSYRHQHILEDMMTMFIMFTESDGANAQILLQYAGVQSWLAHYRKRRVAPLHEHPAIPDESEELSLWLWLNWFTHDYYYAIHESPENRGNLNWLLTPYLMATFKYANTYRTPQPSTPSMKPTSAPRRLPSTAIPGGYLAAPHDALFPPVLHHAAIQLYFSRFQDHPFVTPSIPSSDLFAAAVAQGIHPSAWSLSQPGFPTAQFGERFDAFTPSYMRVSYPSITNSRRWDGEWGRLTGDAGMYRYTPGSMTGIWEGWYKIHEFESHVRLENALLADLDPAAVDPDADPDLDPDASSTSEYPLNVLEDARATHDMQMWRITEYHHRPEFRLSSTSPASVPLHVGSERDAHLPEGFRVVAHRSVWDPVGQRMREGVLVTSKHHPQDIPSFYEAIDRTTAETSPTPFGDYPPDTLPILFLGRIEIPNGGEDGVFTWQPHQFSPGCTIQGTVRPNDGGFVSFRAVQQHDGWGEWLSSGYIVGGGVGGAGWEETGNWVGRWRELKDETGEHGHGGRGIPWEGVFCLRKMAYTT